ncbi:MAG: CDP-alcohol phosphatidyltransferase family protein [Planctomycetota bacterium]
MLTLGNAVCGLAAIAVVTSPYLTWQDETKLLVAGLLIFGGMLFDALDGSAARMTGQESEFGAELDSLCDAITFGTAPAVLVWRFSSGDYLPLKVRWAVGVLYTLCVLIRLARFNVETEDSDDHEEFEGRPSPAAAGTIAAFAIATHSLGGYRTAYAGDNVVGDTYWSTVAAIADWAFWLCQHLLPLIALALAFLMVSRFRYPHLVSQYIGGRRPPHQIGRALFVLIGVFLLHWLILPVAFCYFAFAAPIRSWLHPSPEGSEGSILEDSSIDSSET